jgi:hypothetical protein
VTSGPEAKAAVPLPRSNINNAEISAAVSRPSAFASAPVQLTTTPPPTSSIDEPSPSWISTAT